MLVLEPEIATRDCVDCQTYHYDNGKRTLIGGRPVKRSAGVFPPCRYPSLGCPKGTPENSRALTQQNLLAWKHYQACRAVNRFPEDPIVERNAGAIYETLERIKTRQERDQHDLLNVMILALKGPGNGRR